MDYFLPLFVLVGLIGKAHKPVQKKYNKPMTCLA